MSKANFRKHYLNSLLLTDTKKQKESILEEISQEDIVDITKVHALVEKIDIPSKYRPMVWSLLLEVMPRYKEAREFVRKQKIEEYNDLKEAASILQSGVEEKVSIPRLKQQEILANSTTSITLVYLVKKLYFQNTSHKMEQYPTMFSKVNVVIRWLEVKEPHLFAHLRNSQVSIQDISMRWFRSYFTSILATETLIRIWDLAIRYSSDFLCCVAIVLFQCFKSSILERIGSKGILELLHSSPPIPNTESFLTKAIDVYNFLPSLKPFEPIVPKPLDLASRKTFKLSRGKPVTLKFMIHYITQFGEILFIVGSIPELGNWNESPKMTWREGNIWTITLTLESTQKFEYKYVVLNSNTGHVRWETSQNHKIEVGTSAMEIKDQWEIIVSLPP